MEGLIIMFCLLITFLVGFGFREIADGITNKIRNKQSLADKEEYFKIFNERCKNMNTLTDAIFTKWIQLEADIKKERRKSSNNLKVVN